MVTVRIDDGGVHTLWGQARWPCSSVPLDLITAASTEDTNPAQWAGGATASARAARAAIVRKGPGLVVEREGQAAVRRDRRPRR